MDTKQLLEKIKQHPDEIEFDQIIAHINNHYVYTPGQFTNGLDNHKLINAASENEGSCKIFAFCKHHNLNKQQTLACFGRFYREDVLMHPEADIHANIRTFMIYVLDGIEIGHADILS